MQWGEQRFITRLSINVRRAGIEIRCAHGMAVRGDLFSERSAILIIVIPIDDKVAHVEQTNRQIEVPLFFSRAIQIAQSHQVRGADAMTGLLSRRI